MRPLTRSCFVLLVLERLLLLVLPVLLGICLPSRSSPPFPLHALALIPLTLAKVRLLPILTLSPLMIWHSGQTALFFFLLARAAPALLPTALSVALRPLFPFRQAQFVPVFRLKPVPLCTLFAGLGNTIKSAIFLLLSDSRSVLATVSSPPPFLLSQTLWQIWQELSSLSSCSIRLLWVPGHSFLPGNDTANELARRGTLLAPSAIPCSLSPLTSRIHSRLFSDWRRTVSSKYFDTQVPSISTEELVLPRHARCVLSRLCCNGHSLLLGSYLSRIGRIENSSCSACGHPSQDISHLILHCPATDSLRRSLFGASLSLYDLWSRPWGVARLLGLHGLPACPHPSEGSAMSPSLGRNQQQQQLQASSLNDLKLTTLLHNQEPAKINFTNNCSIFSTSTKSTINYRKNNSLSSIRQSISLSPHYTLFYSHSNSLTKKKSRRLTYQSTKTI